MVSVERYGVNRKVVALQTILIIATMFCCDSGVLGYGAEKLALLGAISIMLFFLHSKVVKKNKKTKGFIAVYLCVFFYLLYNFSISYSRISTMSYLLRFIVIMPLLLLSYDSDYLYDVCKYIQNITIFIAIVYIICYPIQGINAGIYQSLQYTTTTLSVGIGFILPSLFEKKFIRRKDLLGIALCFFAILLTGKRALFVIPIVILLVIVLLSDDYRKYRKLIILTLFATVALSLLAMVKPVLLNSITRIFQIAADSSYNSRTYFWQYALMLWAINPLFGIGFGCFPIHIASGSVDLSKYHYIQAFAAHNIYYQMLAEVGVIGLVLFGFMFVVGMVYTIKVINTLKRVKQPKLMKLSLTAMYCQLWFLLYGLTGNPLYMVGQMFTYFFGLMIIISIRQYLYCQSLVLNSKKSVEQNSIDESAN